MPVGEARSSFSMGHLKDEMRSYALVSLYLFICFSILLLYEASLKTDQASSGVQWSLALVKALILGKFILIGKMLSVGQRADKHPLVHRILLKSLAMLLLLIVFKGLEEVVVSWLHEQPLAQVKAEFFELSWVQLFAPVLLMLLILMPLIAVSEIYKLVGKERLHQLLYHN